jgi:1,4-alpha-glucan branching enzyme
MSKASPNDTLGRFPIGAEVRASGDVDFRLWAPSAKTVRVIFEGERRSGAPLELHPESFGYHAGFSLSAGPAARYRFELNGNPQTYPDPVSRFQPGGPHGSSEVIDSNAFSWTDTSWRGVKLEGQILYEMHIGTFTKEGSWRSAINPQLKTDWGNAINFDGPNSGPVREFFLTNATYWIDEFHLDGLRIDATQDLHDNSASHILAEISARTRAAAQGRDIVLVAENEPQDTRLVRPPAEKGDGLDTLWNDDFHHSAIVALSGRNEAYYSDYNGTPQEFIAAVKYGYLYQGQWYSWQQARRGSFSLDIQPSSFVVFIQNHDQVANTTRGERPNILAPLGKYKALTASLLLAPGTPMLFQGQEFGATTPFLYFCDHKAELSKTLRANIDETLTVSHNYRAGRQGETS